MPRAMLSEIAVPYGDRTRTLRIAEENLAWVLGAKDVPALPDLARAVREAIRDPIGSTTLPELVAVHGTHTVLLVDDNTRLTPQAEILPVLLDELNAAGVPDDDMMALIALGTHRPMTHNEILARYGEPVLDRIRIENLPQREEDFVDLGLTPSGVPIQVSRRFLERDLRIAVGSIAPHMYAGWSGGAKMVQPGVTSHLTTARTHLMAGCSVYTILGEAGNPVRREMEQIAVESGLAFILNVVLNRDAGVVAVVAGDVVAAHRAGVEVARPIHTVKVEKRPDIVIASSHPADRDLWQGFKAINNCGMLVKDGGTLILLIPAPEGIAPDHPYLVELGLTPCDMVLRMVEEDQVADCVGAATYLALDQTRKRASIILVTDGISPEEADRIGLVAFDEFDAALARALAQQGDKAQIGVVTHGGDIVGSIDNGPMVDEE